MPRQSKKNVKSQYVHVLSQGINREYIFNTTESLNKYRILVIENKKKCQIKILAYCIMQNHVHFLIKLENVDKLSHFMHQVNMNYARYYNSQNSRVGYVFRDRYKIQEIENEKHLKTCVAYIHNNPVKAKICKRMEEYKFSSFNEYMYENKIIETNALEEIFGNREIFLNVHKNQIRTLYIDIETKENLIKEYIDEFSKKYKIKQIDFIKNKNILKKLLKELHIENGISINSISKYLKIDRKTVKKYSE